MGCNKQHVLDTHELILIYHNMDFKGVILRIHFISSQILMVI